jgi:hypothetical protein
MSASVSHWAGSDTLWLGMMHLPLLVMSITALLPAYRGRVFYWRRALTWCVDGMRPIPSALLEGLAYREEWRVLGGVFSYHYPCTLTAWNSQLGADLFH